MDRRIVIVNMVGYAQDDLVAFPPAEQRGWNVTVNRDGVTLATVNRNRGVSDLQIETRA
jgi:hypothetical protein